MFNPCTFPMVGAGTHHRTKVTLGGQIEDNIFEEIYSKISKDTNSKGLHGKQHFSHCSCSHRTACG